MNEGGFKALGIEMDTHTHTHTENVIEINIQIPTQVTEPTMCVGSQKVRVFTTRLVYNKVYTRVERKNQVCIFNL